MSSVVRSPKEEPRLDKVCFKWNFQSPLNANRERFSLMGSRSVDLDKGLSSPLLCVPARRPAHLLGCSAFLASPQLLLSCLRRGTTRPRLCTPVACTSQVLVCLLGTAPPTGGTHCESNDLNTKGTKEELIPDRTGELRSESNPRARASSSASQPPVEFRPTAAGLPNNSTTQRAQGLAGTRHLARWKQISR